MAKQVQKVEEKSVPRCLSIAQAGIRTSGQFAQFMSGMMSDLIEGHITPQIGNAAVNAGGKLLKMVEMQYKYGKPNSEGVVKQLDLLEPDNN